MNNSVFQQFESVFEESVKKSIKCFEWLMAYPTNGDNVEIDELDPPANDDVTGKKRFS